MKKISLYLAISLIVIGIMTGIAIGYSLTPDYVATMYKKQGMDLGEADFFLDRRYLDSMITHHRAAMALAEQAQQKSQRQEIKALAKEILNNEPKLIDELYSFKREWYRDSRLAPAPQAINLGDADLNFDLRFLNALIAHHDAGLQMTAEIKAKTSRAAVIDNANAVTDFLTQTKEQFLKWRKEWYNI